MASEPSRGVAPIDMDAVGEAVDLLREAGFAVDGVSEVERNASQGVSFDLALSTPTRVKPLEEHEDEAEEWPEEDLAEFSADVEAGMEGED